MLQAGVCVFQIYLWHKVDTKGRCFSVPSSHLKQTLMSLQDLKPQLSILGVRTSEEGRKRELLFAIQASKMVTNLVTDWLQPHWFVTNVCPH